jgi:ribonuclease P/MRP protein subunit RPP40
MLTDNLGTLTMYLEKDTYERAGLVGQPHGTKGKRGLKPRWGKLQLYIVDKELYLIYHPVVQYDLRSPANFPGKKGFDRLIYACKNVLNQPVTWLFQCLSKSKMLVNFWANYI